MLQLSKLRQLPTRESLQILGVGSIILLFYSLARGAFYLINVDSFQVTATELFLPMKTGLRFDLATLAYGSALGIPALALGAGLSRHSPARRFALWALYLPHALTLFLNMADIIYFKHTFRRQTNELFTVPGEALSASFSEALQYWWLTILTGLTLIALFLTLRALLRLIERRTQRPPESEIWRIWGGRFFLTLAVFGAGVLMARGGTQNRPLRPGMAFVSDNPALGQLALNSGYSVFWSRLHQAGRVLRLMDADSARTIAQSLIKSPADRFLEMNYPFLRQSIAPEDTTRWNIVIFIMEGWNARQTGAITKNLPYPGVTPFFDSLARDGLLFTNFYASGDRSIHAFPAVVASLPNLTGSGILHTSLETTRVFGLGSILKKRGYTTIFAMGAAPSSMGFDSYARACGFVRHYSEDSYPDSIRNRDANQWGVYDEHFLGFIDERLAQTPEPFALTFFSLSAHSPFVVPDAFAEGHPIEDDTDIDGAASDAVNAQRQRRALRYADYSLGKYFETARRREYFKRTIFIITGDHTGWEEHANRYTALEQFQVPLLIYAPNIISHGLDSLPANQVDILPTVLSLLGGRALNAGLGQSLLESQAHRVSFSAKASVVNFLYDSLFVQATSEKVLGVYNYRADLNLTTNLLTDSTALLTVSEAVRAYRAYLQTGLNAMIADRIFPAAPLLQDILRNSDKQD